VWSLGQRVGSLVGIVKPPDLNLISAVVHHGCMGLPQELVDHITDMLDDDIQALKACSLACRALFASTRRLIYRGVRLPPQGYLDDPAALHSLSLMGERGLFQYARKVHICFPPVACNPDPDTLLPHLRHFQSLNRIHTLVIDYYDAVTWALPEHYKTYFVHFYPTLTSLTLFHACGHYRLILQFALQFPNLEDLCLDCVEDEGWYPDMVIPAIVDQSPPLRGHLRFAGAVDVAQYPTDLAYELPNGINFRSVELEGLAGSDAQHILNGCAHSLENLIITLLSAGTRRLSLLSLVMTGCLANFPPAEGEEFVGLTFAGINDLRRLTFRMWLSHMSTFEPQLLLGAFSTVTSPVFCELVLELTGNWYLDDPSWVYQDRWEEIDRHLEERFSDRGDFKIIIRNSDSDGWEYFQRHIKGCFPLLASRGCIEFEKPRD
jgi:hypothetical protein